MTRPWLSVIIPTCNGQPYIRQALDSVITQEEPLSGIEVIVVDDGSSDATLAVVAKYIGRLPLIIERRGHSGNWVAGANHGMRLARGEYISILHQDDLWRPARLRMLRRLTHQHPAAATYVHPCWYADARGRRIGYWRCPFPPGVTVLSPRQVLPRMLVQCCYGMPAPLFRAGAARDVGLMDESLWFSADWDFWLKLGRAHKTVYCPTPLALFRLHSASQTISRGRDTDEIHTQQLNVLERHQRILGTEEIPPCVWRVARFSASVNAALIALLDGHRPDLRRLSVEFCALGPAGWRRWISDSRILERCLSRLRAGAVGWRGQMKLASAARVLVVGTQGVRSDRGGERSGRTAAVAAK